jgi:diguanylate cyclase (GGDEF)-like protein/PAS domain S-box-containing protein
LDSGYGNATIKMRTMLDAFSLEGLGDTFENIISLTQHLMRADSAYCYIAEVDTLRLVASSGSQSYPTTLYRTEALPGRVWDAGQAQISNQLWGEAIGSLGAPVTVAGTVVAVLGASYTAANATLAQLEQLVKLSQLLTDSFERRSLQGQLHTQGDEHLEAVQNLEDSSGRLRLFEVALTNANEAVLITEVEESDLGTRIIFANTSFERTMGYTQAEVYGRHPNLLRGHQHDPDGFRATRNRLGNGETVDLELIEYRKDGTPIWVELSIVPIFDLAGHLTHRVSWRRDITERKRSALLETDRNRVLELQVSGAPLPATLEALSHLLRNQYPDAEPLLFLRHGSTLSLAHADHLDTDQRGAMTELPLEFGNGSSAFAVWQAVPVVTEDAGSDPVWAKLSRLASRLLVKSAWAMPILHGESDTAIGALELHFRERRRASAADLERLGAIAKLAAAAIERTRLVQRLEEQSTRDSLTGLANRFALEMRLEDSVESSAKRGSKLAVMQIDLDGFRQFNDTLGHGVGDELLVAVAARWRALLPSKDLLARMGGDEFGLIAHHLESELEAATLARQLLKAMREPFELRGLELVLGASIGFAMYPEDGSDAATLIRHADTAMNAVKRHGKNDVQRFRTQMNTAAKERLELEVALRRALERSELEVYYQPQVNGAGQIVSLEALTYWNHPKEGMISPARFIPIAEESGLIIPLGLWVLERSCMQIARWRREGLNVSLAVNVNVQQFLRADFAESVARTLKATGVEPRHLELELTESALMQDLNLAVERLSAIRRLGVRVSIDDFGTGYSSLSYLQKLPVNAVKIDRSFVSHLEADASGWSMVNLIVMLARHLRLGVVAEGVETESQFEALRDMAVDRVQGFLFSRPVSAETIYPQIKQGYAPRVRA